MGMDIRLQMKLSQRLIMTPALQQAIKMLPMTRMELISAIRQEIEENPFLEEAATEDDSQEADAEAVREATEVPEEPVRTEFQEDAVMKDVVQEKTQTDEVDWDSYLQEEAYDGGTGEGYQERPSLENTLKGSESLYDHLLWQLNVTIVQPKQNEIGQLIVADIDDDGFFKTPLTEIAEESGATLDEVAEVLAIIKRFDPTGVGAADVKECLQIQAEALEPDDPIIREIIAGHLGNLSERNYAKIARDLGVDVERVMESIEFIRGLDPAPGRTINPEKAHYVEPDLYLVKMNDDYHVLLNDDGVPRLKISPYYRTILKGKEQVQESAKEFVESKFRAAEWLIKSIEQRRQTMLKVGRSIVKFQRGFLDHGMSYLKPLVLKDVAEDIGMHESTISRVTRNKYIHTPQGIYELKFFFHSGVDSYLGNMVSSVRVKEMIKKIVTEEDPKKPATDDKIVKMLEMQDVKIARRTVTKYRKELKVPPASKRKRIY